MAAAPVGMPLTNGRTPSSFSSHPPAATSLLPLAAAKLATSASTPSATATSAAANVFLHEVAEAVLIDTPDGCSTAPSDVGSTPVLASQSSDGSTTSSDVTPSASAHACEAEPAKAAESFPPAGRSRKGGQRGSSALPALASDPPIHQRQEGERAPERGPWAIEDLDAQRAGPTNRQGHARATGVPRGGKSEKVSREKGGGGLIMRALRSLSRGKAGGPRQGSGRAAGAGGAGAQYSHVGLETSGSRTESPKCCSHAAPEGTCGVEGTSLPRGSSTPEASRTLSRGGPSRPGQGQGPTPSLAEAGRSSTATWRKGVGPRLLARSASQDLGKKLAALEVGPAGVRTPEAKRKPDVPRTPPSLPTAPLFLTPRLQPLTPPGGSMVGPLRPAESLAPPPGDRPKGSKSRGGAEDCSAPPSARPSSTGAAHVALNRAASASQDKERAGRHRHSRSAQEGDPLPSGPPRAIVVPGSSPQGAAMEASETFGGGKAMLRSRSAHHPSLGDVPFAAATPVEGNSQPPAELLHALATPPTAAAAAAASPPAAAVLQQLSTEERIQLWKLERMSKLTGYQGHSSSKSNASSPSRSHNRRALDSPLKSPLALAPGAGPLLSPLGALAGPPSAWHKAARQPGSAQPEGSPVLLSPLQSKRTTPVRDGAAAAGIGSDLSSEDGDAVGELGRRGKDKKGAKQEHRQLSEAELAEMVEKIDEKLKKLRHKRAHYQEKLQRIGQRKERLAGPIEQWLRPVTPID